MSKYIFIILDVYSNILEYKTIRAKDTKHAINAFYTIMTDLNAVDDEYKRVAIHTNGCIAVGLNDSETAVCIPPGNIWYDKINSLMQTNKRWDYATEQSWYQFIESIGHLSYIDLDEFNRMVEPPQSQATEKPLPSTPTDIATDLLDLL